MDNSSRGLRSSKQLCELGTWKGLENAPEVCACKHPIQTYRTVGGNTRCGCCFGLAPEHSGNKP